MKPLFQGLSNNYLIFPNKLLFRILHILRDKSVVLILKLANYLHKDFLC